MKTNQIQQEPSIDVGIMGESRIGFFLHRCCDVYAVEGDEGMGRTAEALAPLLSLEPGGYCACVEDGQLSVYAGGNAAREGSVGGPAAGRPCPATQPRLRGARRYRIVARETLRPSNTSSTTGPASQSSFSLQQVRIGIDFHWDRRQDQSFAGELHLLQDGPRVLAINRLPLEDYLLSVIASEMSAHAGLELLKAHAVISRSWLLAQGLGGPRQQPAPQHTGFCGYDRGEEHIRWYERDAHRLFDVCADDHCQRYQGLQQACTPQVREALAATRGLVLACQDEICDARFYKCCGGRTENFQAAWADTPKTYLRSIADNLLSTDNDPDLRDEAQARAFICSRPAAFCNTQDKAVLRQVLNDYDRETTDFYRWQVRYSVDELTEIVRQRSGLDLGRILALQPVERSESARLVKLRIVGEKGSIIVGKELEIRKFLSRSHLYSSAFVVDEERNSDGETTAFVLHGAGWGHGVGLCQIGAAMMSHQGYGYRDILQHYYPDTRLEKLYS